MLEILLWNRIEGWWNTSRIISGLQGACKKGQSCVHIAMLLQETVSRALETNRNVFVSYLTCLKLSTRSGQMDSFINFLIWVLLAKHGGFCIRAIMISGV